MLKEDEQERRNFDAVTADLYGGDPLAAVQTTLTMWAKQAPPSGSYGAMLAIFANELEKAKAIQRQAYEDGLRDAVRQFGGPEATAMVDDAFARIHASPAFELENVRKSFGKAMLTASQKEAE